MFKDRAYVCNLCRKVITYSVQESGQTRPCPFCKSTITLPAANMPARHHHPDKRPSSAFRLLFILLILLAAAGVGAFVFLSWFDAGKTPDAQSVAPVLANLMPARVATAPDPVKIRGVDATVAVTEARYGCPELYQAAVKRVVPTETPVFWVKLRVANNGKKTMEFRPWRLLDALHDPKKVSLRQIDGHHYSPVSFGTESDPVDAQKATALAPGETLTDIILFFCNALPEHDLELTIPCENLGGKGDVRILIPAGMIRRTSE